LHFKNMTATDLTRKSQAEKGLGLYYTDSCLTTH